MEIDWTTITHITRINPAKPLPADIEDLKHTDLVIIGGSNEVTEADTYTALQQVIGSFPELPLIQEPYASAQISSEMIASVDWIVMPVVFNGDWDHFVGNHLRMLSQLSWNFEGLLGQDISISKVLKNLIPVGYIIQNMDSNAATVAGVSEPLSVAEIQGAALATEILYDFPVLYVDYSKQFGETEDIAAAATYLEDTMLLYGGGIDSTQKAANVLAAGADAVVIDDCFHEDIDEYAQTTRLSSFQESPE